MRARTHASLRACKKDDFTLYIYIVYRMYKPIASASWSMRRFFVRWHKRTVGVSTPKKIPFYTLWIYTISHSLNTCRIHLIYKPIASASRSMRRFFVRWQSEAVLGVWLPAPLPTPRALPDHGAIWPLAVGVEKDLGGIDVWPCGIVALCVGWPIRRAYMLPWECLRPKKDHFTLFNYIWIHAL